jgi:hypothetical protein
LARFLQSNLARSISEYRLGRRAPSEPARIPYIKWTKTFGDAQSIETQHVSIFACRHPC